MLAYSYDTNGYYIESIQCKIDPLETEIQGKEIFLLPAHATFTQIVDYDNKTQRLHWDGEQWDIEEIPQPEIIDIPPKLLREQAYNNRPMVIWSDRIITVNEANYIYMNYFIEGNIKADEIQPLIMSAKEEIRQLYPDEVAEIGQLHSDEIKE